MDRQRSAPGVDVLLEEHRLPRKAIDVGAGVAAVAIGVQVIRAQGYSATTVDDICGAAGLTKGAFFHHFKSKEDLAVAAAAHFSEMAERLFAGAPYRELADPLDRVLGYIDFRSAIIDGPIPEFTCLLGTLDPRGPKGE